MWERRIITKLYDRYWKDLSQVCSAFKSSRETTNVYLYPLTGIPRSISIFYKVPPPHSFQKNTRGRAKMINRNLQSKKVICTHSTSCTREYKAGHCDPLHRHTTSPVKDYPLYSSKVSLANVSASWLSSLLICHNQTGMLFCSNSKSNSSGCLNRSTFTTGCFFAFR